MVLVPETRFEAFLAKIAGESGPDLEPITRTEAFLDDIAGAGHDLEPRTRFEYWLQKIAERPSDEAPLTGVLRYEENQDRLVMSFSRPVSHIDVYVDPARALELRNATDLNVRRLLSVNISPIGVSKAATTAATQVVWTGSGYDGNTSSPTTAINLALYPATQGSGYLIAGYDYYWFAY